MPVEAVPDINPLPQRYLTTEPGLGGVIKQRLAREGQGKSGGFRSIVLFRRGEKAFFVYGFAKSEYQR